MINVELAYELFQNDDSYTHKKLVKAMFENNIDRKRLFNYYLLHADIDAMNNMNLTEIFVYDFVHMYIRDSYSNPIMYNSAFTKKLIKFYKYIHTISLDELSKYKKYILLSHSILYLLAAYKEIKIPRICFKYFIEDLKFLINYHDSSNNNSAIKHFIGMLLFKKTIIEQFHKLKLNEIDMIFKKIYDYMTYMALYDDNELYYDYFSYYCYHTNCSTFFNVIFSIANDEDKIKLIKSYKDRLTTNTIMDIIETNENLPIEIENCIINMFLKDNINYVGDLIFNLRRGILNYSWSKENKEKLNALRTMYELNNI